VTRWLRQVNNTLLFVSLFTKSGEKEKFYSLCLGEVVKSSKTGREAVVVCNHDGRIQRLEVQHDHGVAVEPRLRLQGQGDALGGPHSCPLVHAGRHGDVVHGLGHAQHHRLHTILWTGETQVCACTDLFQVFCDAKCFYLYLSLSIANELIELSCL